MNISLGGLKIKLLNLFRVNRENIKAWFIFLLSLVVSYFMFWGVKGYLQDKNFYTKIFFKKQYLLAQQYDKQLNEYLNKDYSEADLIEIDNTLKALDELKSNYESIKLDPNKAINFSFLSAVSRVDQFNSELQARIKKINDIQKQLNLLKIYVYTTEIYMKFDKCIKRVQFNKSDTEIYKSIMGCYKQIEKNDIEKYAKEINCKELETLVRYFKAYKDLANFYYYNSKHNYDKASEYRDRAQKNLDVTIDWSKCFPFVKK